MKIYGGSKNMANNSECNFFEKYIISIIGLIIIFFCCTSCGESKVGTNENYISLTDGNLMSTQSSSPTIASFEKPSDPTINKSEIPTCSPSKAISKENNDDYGESINATPFLTQNNNIREPVRTENSIVSDSKDLNEVDSNVDGFVSNNDSSNSVVSKPTDVNFSSDNTSSLESKEILLAKDILGKIITPHMTETEKVLSIFDYLIDTLEPGLAWAGESGYRALLNKKTNGWGYANAFILLCDVAGIKCELITGTVDNGTETGSHEWNQVCIDGNWYNVDIPWCDMYEDSRLLLTRYTYFLLSDKQIQLDHNPYFSSEHSCENSLREDIFKNIYGNKYVGNKHELEELIIKAIENEENFIEGILCSNFSRDELYEAIEKIENQYNSKQDLCIKQKSFHSEEWCFLSKINKGVFSLSIDNCHNEHLLHIDESPERTYNSIIIQKLKCSNCPYTETTVKKYEEFIKEKCLEKFNFINSLRKDKNLNELGYMDNLQTNLDQFVYDNKIELDYFWQSKLEEEWKSFINNDGGKLVVIHGFSIFYDMFSIDEFVHYVSEEYTSVVISAVTDTKDGECLDCMLIYLK